MQSYWYLMALIISLAVLAVLDWRYRLALFWNAKKTGLILGLNLLFFVAWDIVLVLRGIVSTNQAWVSGLHVVSGNMPVEELLFLTLLGYQVLLLWRWRCMHS